MQEIQKELQCYHKFAIFEGEEYKEKTETSLIFIDEIELKST